MSTTTPQTTDQPNETIREVPSTTTLKGLCQRALVQAGSRDELLTALANILQNTIHPDTIVRVFATSEGVKVEGLLHPAEGLNPDFQTAFSKHGLVALQTGTTQQTRIGRPPSILFIAVPVMQASGCVDCLAAIFTSPTTTSDVLTAVMELVTTHVSLWDARRASVQQEELAETAAAILDLTGRAQTEDVQQRAAQRIADDLMPYLDGPNLAIVSCKNHGSLKLEVEATSVDESQSANELSEFLESAAIETLIRDSTSIWPALEFAEQHSLLTHKQLAQQTGANAVVSVPLRHDSLTPWGVLIAWGDESLVSPPDALRFLEAAAEPIARSLSAVGKNEKPWLQRMVGKLEDSVRSSTGLMCWAATLLVAALMCVPFPYWVECECEVQPVVRRFIAAPFEAKLEEALVEPGDVVTEDQLLAKLDGREIHWELSGVQAELHRVRKERDGHIAQQEYGDAEIAKFETERLQLKQQMLMNRGENLEIRSPISGIIIAGDLKKTEGAPLSVGQTLFEIAPLQQMEIEVRIPESDIAYVSSEMPVEIRLDAYPSRSWSDVLQEIDPRAEVVDETNAFLSEVPIDNTQELLRPGMRGRAWVKTPSRPLAWNLFHKSWERMMMWFGV